MIVAEEHLIFIKQLGRLFDEFSKCKDDELKQEISEDIQLLSEVIDS